MTVPAAPAVGANFLSIDCDITGHRSVMDLVEAGTVVAYPCKTFAETENIFWHIYYGRIPMPKVLIVDTVTRLATNTRLDVVLDPALKGQKTIESLGEGAVTNKREYGITGDKIIRLLRNIYELPCISMFLAHESQREDPMSTVDKTTVDLQRMILSNVITATDAVVRLRPTPTPIEHNGLLWPAGSRQLLLAPTSDSAVGVRSHLELPPFLMNPTLDDFVRAIGGWQYFPHNMIVFGPPKIGKTCFATNARRGIQRTTP